MLLFNLIYTVFLEEFDKGWCKYEKSILAGISVKSDWSINARAGLTLAFVPLLTSSALTKIGIVYTPALQKGKIYPVMPRSEWSG